MLTGQVAPPAERYNLREDLRAWAAAVRGLRENPLVTHLRLAEQRRLKRIPRWRRNLPVTLTALGLAATFIFVLPKWLALAGMPGSLLTTYQIAIATGVLTLAWFMQGVFNCVVGALGVLGRYHKRPNHLSIDDFTCLSSLTDHEIVTGAVSVLLPPLLWRVVVIGAGICTLPVLIWLIVYLQFNQETSLSLTTDYISYIFNQFQNMPTGTWHSLMMYTAILATLLILAGASGSIGLVLLFMSLGRGLKVESFAAISAFGYAVIQIIYPVLIITITISSDAGIYWGNKADIGTFLPGFLLILIWFPTLMCLALGWARRNPNVRLSLAIASPLLLWAICWPLTILCYCLFDPFYPDSGPAGFMASTAHAFALSYSSVSVLSPVIAINPAYFMPVYSVDMYNGEWSQDLNWIKEIIPVMSVRVIFVILIQTIMLYILSRFAREAVRAKRSRGD